MLTDGSAAELKLLRKTMRLGIEMRRIQALYFRARGRGSPEATPLLEKARKAERDFDDSVKDWLAATGQGTKPDVEKPYALPERLTQAELM